MSSLTNIVKSAFVVDDRDGRGPAAVEAVGGNVIKRWSAPVENKSRQRDRQSYVDELNRVRVEISESKAELRRLKREMEETEEALRFAKAVFSEQGGAAGDADEAWRKMREEAQNSADLIVARAHEQAAAILEETRNNGYLEGFNNGYEQARGEFRDENQPEADRLQALIERITEFEQDQLRNNEQDLVRLVMAVAAKVLHQELDAKPELLVSMLREIVEEHRREDFIKITISKELAPIKVKASKTLADLISGLGANIVVGFDGDMKQGECLVETSKGFTDLSIDTQLNNIAELLEP